MTLGSLFDGSGGFPLAGVLNGIEPVWASEIEPYPLRVTAARFPNMKQYGDITKMDGRAIEPVDIITFGSPCQDLSVAGKQAGIHNGTRSSLFFHAVRIIKEMREATNGEYPKFAVWENVPGAFSSNQKRDFAAVLEALASVCKDGVSVPVPKKWEHAGCLVGDGWSIAWRLYDAQYWGVPQRRKRIYLICCFGSERAGEILFESEGVSGNSEPSGAKGEDTSRDPQEGAGETGGGVIPINTMVATRDNDEKRTTFGVGEPDDPQFTLSAAHEHAVAYGIDRPAFNQGINAKYNFAIDDNLSAPMVARGPNAVCVLNDQGGREMSVTEDRTGTLRAQEHGHQPLVTVAYGICSYASNSMKSANPHSGVYEADTSRTLDLNGGNPACNQGGIIVLEGNGARPSHKGDGYKASDTMYTLNTIEQHAVCVDMGGGKSQCGITDNISPVLTATHHGAPAVCVGNGQVNQSVSDKAGALNCMHDQQAVLCFEPGAMSRCGGHVYSDGNSGTLRANAGDNNQAVLYEMQHASDVIRENKDIAPTLQHRMGTGGNNIPLALQEDDPIYIVRRLTPLECCRLQGFPDWWEDGVEGSDTARYKMWGNGIALPCARDVLRRIAENVRH